MPAKYKAKVDAGHTFRTARTLACIAFAAVISACGGGGGGGGGTPIHLTPPERVSAPVLSTKAQYNTPGQSRGLLLEGEMLYVADGAAGLIILDLPPDQGQPYPIGRLGLLSDGRAYSVQKNGNYLYMTARTEGIYVIDVSSPTSPSLVTVLPTPSDTTYSSLVGNRLYVTASGHFLIFDVSDPANPVLLSATESLSPLLQLRVVDNLAYVAAYNRGLVIFDISDASSPRLLSATRLSFNASALEVNGEAAMVGGGTSLAMVDITNTSAPSVIATTTIGQLNPDENTISDLEMNSGFLYIAASSGGVLVADISRPTDIIIVESIAAPPASAFGLISSGRTLLVADDAAGVQVIDIFATTDRDGDGKQDGADIFPDDPQEWVDADGDGMGDNADMDDDNDGVTDDADAFPFDPTESSDSDNDNVGDNRDLFPLNPLEWEDRDLDGVADNSDPDQGVTLTRLSSLDTDGQTRGIVKDDDVVYAADGTNGVRVYKLQADASLQEIGSFKLDPTTGNDISARSLQKVGDILYVAYRTAGLYVLDVSNPANPTVITRRDTRDRATFVTVFGDRLYLSDRRMVQIFDISDPAAPVVLGAFGNSQELREYHRLVVENGIAYVAGYYTGLVILDVRDPANIRQIGRSGGEGFAYWAIAKREDLIFIGGEGSGLRVIDVSDPTTPEVVATLPLPSEAIPKPSDQPPFKMELKGDYLFVADGYSGVQVVNVRDPLAPVIDTQIELSGYTWDFTIDQYSIVVGSSQEGIHVLNLGESVDHDGDQIPNYLDAKPLEAN